MSCQLPSALFRGLFIQRQREHKDAEWREWELYRDTPTRANLLGRFDGLEFITLQAMTEDEVSRLPKFVTIIERYESDR